MFRAIICLAVFHVLSACAPRQNTTFAPDAFRHDDYAYRVTYTDAAGKGVLSPDWLLDNYYESRGTLRAKRGSEYVTKFRLDANGDGITDTTATQPAFDLRFKHRRTAGVIWLRTVPLSIDAKEKQLEVLGQAYLDAMASSGYEVVSLDDDPPKSAEHRFVAIPLESEDLKVAGQEAHALTFDVADVDEALVSPRARKKRVKLVLVRTPFAYYIGEVELPVLMIAGYSNLPDDFESGRSEFDRFLARIGIAGEHGVVPGQKTVFKEEPKPAAAPDSEAEADKNPTPPKAAEQPKPRRQRRNGTPAPRQSVPKPQPRPSAPANTDFEP